MGKDEDWGSPFRVPRAVAALTLTPVGSCRGGTCEGAWVPGWLLGMVTNFTTWTQRSQEAGALTAPVPDAETAPERCGALPRVTQLEGRDVGFSRTQGAVSGRHS